MAGRIMRSRQAGTTTVEVAIVAGVLLLAIFALIETGRLLWTWETLNEATRRGARVAAVCPQDHPAIANVAVFNNPLSGGASAVLPDLSSADVNVTYLDANGNPPVDWCAIRYVRVSITYQHAFAIPAFGALLNAPDFETTLPRESLGKVPGIGFQCFGLASPTPVCT